MSYATARRDFERLEAIRECDDWGWVEESFLFFLQNPTKKFAEGLYIRLIEQWLSENEETDETAWAYKKYSQ